MPMWLTHMWQYISENGFELVTDLPPLPPLCNKVNFLWKCSISKVAYQGIELAKLNQCWMWLQVITLAEFTDGTGASPLSTMLAGK